jgi:hypothetical protein
MTAFGVSDKVEKAKDILIHAAIGLVIVLAAYAISKFVFGALTGENPSAIVPTEQAAVLGCCYPTDGSGNFCGTGLQQSACAPDYSWQAGDACPAECGI